MDISPQDERFLLQLIRRGEATLVLGAGATFSSQNAAKKPVKTSLDLASALAAEAALEYNGESLHEVIGAAKNYLTDVQINKIYQREYKGVSPSKEFESLFRYFWKRVYTWNIDDGVKNITERSAQRRRYYNGITDSVDEFEGQEFLHVVQLHGDIVQPEKGLIMSEMDYSDALSRGDHKWYRRAAQDYLANNPIFVGSSLSEPILKAELQRAMRDAGTTLGRAYLVIPENLTTIQEQNFRNQGILHIKATLSEFSAWLQRSLPGGVTSADVLATHQIKISRDELGRLSQEERQAAFFLAPIKVSTLESALAAEAPAAKSLRGRRFLRGFPPTWETAASDIPVVLSGAASLSDALRSSLLKRDRLFVVTGQAGSGKSTATMQALLQHARNNPDAIIYELKGEVRYIRSAFSLVSKLHDSHVIIFIPDMFLYGDSFGADMESLSGRNITIVSTARSGEWRDRLERYMGTFYSTHNFQRFTKIDFAPLIERILKYVPAPGFVKLSDDERVRALGKSQQQLLIALREATESRNFDDIIANEFESLPDQDTRSLFLIVSVSTIARVGIATEAAREIYQELGGSRPFKSALAALEGIVGLDAYGRLIARHELYVRHVLDALVDFYELRNVIIATLKSYTKYKVPIIKNVNRRDGQLFKYIINHDFIMRRARAAGAAIEGLKVYEEFEVEFQLDGHYWLQYGLYLAALGSHDEAIQMLRKSIQAYPDNVYAVHAYADLQFKAARKRESFDHVTAQLLEEAVAALSAQDRRPDLFADDYPLVTLSTGHVGVLIAHKRLDEARRMGKVYFDRLQEMERRITSSSVQAARERVFRFLTLGEWPS